MVYRDFKQIVDEKGIDNILFKDFPELSKADYDKYYNKYTLNLKKQQEEEQKQQERKLKSEKRQQEEEQKQQKRKLKLEKKQKEEEQKQLIINQRLEQYKDYVCNDKGFPLDLHTNYRTFLDKLEDTTFHENVINKRRYINDKEIDDVIYSKLTSAFNDELKIGHFNEMVKAVNAKATENTINPITDALKAGLWDSEKRVDNFFIKYLGAKDCDFTRSLTRKWFYNAIKRICEPGCPADSMIIFVDKKQGTGKTKIMQRLANCLTNDNLKYFYVQKGGSNISKDVYQCLSSTWITIIDEMSMLDKNDIQFIKAFISETVDTFRRPYEVAPKDFPRTCIFCGNTNSSSFLKDYTADDVERRFWTIPCNGNIYSPEEWKQILTDDELRQVWYEIYDFYMKNPEFDYTLNIQERDTLGEMQKQFKSANEDLALPKLDELLHRKYPRCIDLNTTSEEIVNWYKNQEFGGYKLNEIKLNTLRLVLNSIPGGAGRSVDWVSSVIHDYFSDDFEIYKQQTHGAPVRILKRKDIDTKFIDEYNETINI